ncbi:MAG: cell wall hydrolase, partial [Lachnospiraceae bacterium]|nr:cell wall hydrolase [Lachnospiraceae bacterium]
MKSDSIIKKIAGTLMLAIVFNACCSSIDASAGINKSDITSERSTVSKESEASEMVVRVLSTTNAAKTTVEELEKLDGDHYDDIDNEIQNLDGVDLETQVNGNEVAEGNIVENAEPTPAPLYANYGVCNKEVVTEQANIRTSASEEADIAGRFRVDDVCVIETSENGWYKITSGDVSGYIRQDLIVTGLSDEEIVNGYAKIYATVKAETLNLRRNADENADILDQFSTGDKLTVKENLGQWIRVSYDSTEGYVASDYVDVATTFNYAMSIERERELEAQRLEEERIRQEKIAAEKAAKKAEEERIAAEKARKAEEERKAQEAREAAKRAAAIQEEEVAVAASSSIEEVDDEDLMYMSAIVYCEAGAEPYEGMLAVASVIMNRVNSSSYPNSIVGVLSQSGQFPPYYGEKFKKAVNWYKNGTLSSSCIKAAKAALNGSNNIGSRKHFNGANSTNRNYDG